MHNPPDFRTNLCFEALWDTKQWFEPAFVQLDSEGRILSISEESKTQEPTEKIRGFVIPGHNNAHSHAFQYALAGLAEHLPHHSAVDDFWSWREAMYQLANTILPEEMEDDRVAPSLCVGAAGGPQWVVDVELKKQLLEVEEALGAPRHPGRVPRALGALGARRGGLRRLRRGLWGVRGVRRRVWLSLIHI